MRYVVYSAIVGTEGVICKIFTMNSEELVSESVEDTQRIAKDLIQSLSEGTVVALIGDLGSGKTTFSQGIGKALGIKRHLQSPTFTIMKEYHELKHEKFSSLYHIDLYRLESPIDLPTLGIDEVMSDPHGLVIIEWAEKVKSQLPEKRIEITFEHVDEGKRKISIQHC